MKKARNPGIGALLKKAGAKVKAMTPRARRTAKAIARVKGNPARGMKPATERRLKAKLARLTAKATSGGMTAADVRKARAIVARLKKAARFNPGESGAFERCVASVTARGTARSPRGVCAAAGRKKYGSKKFAKMAAAGKRRAKATRANPVETAAERYEFFHGRPPDEVTEVTTRIHEHSVLSGIGKLKRLVILAVDGMHRVALKDFRGALLSQDEKGKQLFIEGGDQAVNLADFGITKPHEREVLGAVEEIVYFTRKDHLTPEDGGRGNYAHPFGKKREGEKYVPIKGGRLPIAAYDVRNKLISLIGGTYDLPEVGIRG